ncbi:hypothetical protein BJ912DRAFT_851183 [Pholiota molesta]|nr:hypothetical protein BJ912DRAFT_851183 [Pholiota molesta]
MGYPASRVLATFIQVLLSTFLLEETGDELSRRRCSRPNRLPPPTTAPGLRALDGSFRCDICGDLYDAPVTISCGHCFCSTVRPLCKQTGVSSCRKISNEAHIRPNPVLESVISAWKDARCAEVTIYQVPLQLTQHCFPKGHSAQKRKRSEESSSQDAFDGNAAGPSLIPFTPRGAAATTPKPYSRIKKLKPKSDAVVDCSTIPSSDVDEQELTPSRPRNSLVDCPACQKKVQFALINAHMDNDCKDLAGPSDSAATSWSKLMGMPGKNGQNKGKHKYVTSIFYPFCATNAHLPGTNRKRDSDSDDDYPLPLANYTTLKDKQLKDMLVEQGLPMSGDRPLWEQRHQRWVMIFNANLDKSIPNRRTRADLKKDLKKWEEERGKKKKFAVKDSVNYQIEHKDEFARLVSQARQTRVNPPIRPTDSDSTTRRSSPPPTESKPTLPIPRPHHRPSDTISIGR